MRASGRASAAIRKRQCRSAALIAGLLAALTRAGCTSYIAHEQERKAILQASDRALDRDRIQIQPGDLALPYDQLGVLQYREPFSAKAIDENHIESQLRQMAIAQWGGQVDAIIHVQSTLSADSSAVNVSGQAVRVRGDCSFCRHQGGYPNGN